METDLSRLVDTLPGLVWTALPDGHIDFLNRRWCEYTGLSVEEGCGWGWLKAIHSEDRSDLLERWHSIRADGVAQQFSARLRRLDGEYRWFLFRTCPLTDASGQLVKWCGINSDIEDQRQADDALKRSEARKAAILEAALDCLVTIDHAGCITGFNPAAERMFGYSQDEVVGKRLAEVIVPPSLRESYQQEFARYLATGEARVIGRHLEMTALRADGSEFPVEIAITRIPSDGPPAFTGYVRDITARKRSEELLRRSTAYLEHAQKLSHTGSIGFRLTDGQFFWSEETAHIYGYDPATPPAMEMVLQRTHPDDIGLFAEGFRRAALGGASFGFEHRLLMPDGSVKHVRTFAHSAKDEGGNDEILGAVMDITEQHQTEADLQEVLARVKESETEFRTIIEGIPTLAWSTRADGYAEFFSQRWLDFSGMSKDEVQGRGWMRAVHPEDVEMLYEQWTKIMASEKPGEVEARLRRFDGVYRWFLFRAAPFFDHDGKISKWYGTNTDIDHFKRAEEELRRSWHHLHRIINSIPGLVCTMSPSGEVQELNQQLLEYFGKTPEELKGWAMTDAVHPDDLPRVVAAWTHSFTTETPYDVEHRCRRADGIYRWFQIRARPVREAEGRIMGWYVLLTDIEDRKRAEEALRSSERDLNETVNTIPTMVWSTLPDGACDFLNQRWLDYTGLTAAQALGWGWDVAVHREDLGPLVEYWKSCLATGTPIETELRMRRRDGVYRWFLLRGNPLRDESGKIVKWLGTNTDIHDRKQAEEELHRNEATLRELQDELAHIARVTTMGELAASIAHEVNQPIAGVVINGNACLRWLARVEDSVEIQEARQTLQRIIRDGNRAGEIIARIRALFKKKESAKEPLDLNEVIREIIVLAKSEMDKPPVALRLELSSDLPRVLGDRVQLQQVVLNLILNAIEAMATVVGRSRDLTIQTRQEDEREVSVTVRDSGMGLSPESVGHVFAPFHTTKPGGLGMGLSISRSIVENHNGRLWVTEHEGPGASFHFTLPAHPSQSGPDVEP